MNLLTSARCKASSAPLRGNYDESQSHYLDSIRIRKSLGSTPEQLTIPTHNLALICLLRGDLQHAQQWLNDPSPVLADSMAAACHAVIKAELLINENKFKLASQELTELLTSSEAKAAETIKPILDRAAFLVTCLHLQEDQEQAALAAIPSPLKPRQRIHSDGGTLLCDHEVCRFRWAPGTIEWVKTLAESVTEPALNELLERRIHKLAK